LLRFLTSGQLAAFPLLADTMFRDRAAQFRDRHGWYVSVDAAGHERDAYDDLDPLYMIWQNADGHHGGSLRLLPTTGRCMVNDNFPDLLTQGALRDPAVWECTRFGLGAAAGPRVAAALMLGGGEVLSGLGLRHLVGVFDRRMERIYAAIGASPEVLGTRVEGARRISAGLWGTTPIMRRRVGLRAGLSPEAARLWFRRAMLTDLAA
jgi:N-acyl-L-homoserine lactone synthetase